jgi:6-methylsalicylate decarboxylase
VQASEIRASRLSPASIFVLIPLYIDGVDLRCAGFRFASSFPKNEFNGNFVLNYMGRLVGSCGCCDRTTPATDRRRVLKGMAAVGLAASASMIAPVRPAMAATPRLIDVHQHIAPPFYVAENHDRLAGSGKINPAWIEWTPQKALDAMDQHGVETAMLSLSTPGVWFGDAEAARSTSRRCNEYTAALVKDHPRRFGLFAVLPLPDTDGSLREIEYAFDVLKADGIGLLTSYGDKWLGDTAYQPVFEELHRRKVVVFVHPTVANCCRTLMREISPLAAEVPQDTTRAVMSLLFSGTLTRFKDIRFIFCHAGGSVPMVAARMTQYGPKDLIEKLPNGVDFELKRLYYDIAVSGHRPAVAALTSYVPISQILFGSDFPYRPLGETADSLSQLGLSPADLQAIGRDNTLALLPNRVRP